MKPEATGRVLLIGGAIAAASPLDEVDMPAAVLIALLLVLLTIAFILTARLNRIEGTVSVLILVGFTLTCGHAFGRWLSISYLRAFLGAYFWTCVALTVHWIIPTVLDWWTARSKR